METNFKLHELIFTLGWRVNARSVYSLTSLASHAVIMWDSVHGGDQQFQTIACINFIFTH